MALPEWVGGGWGVGGGLNVSTHPKLCNKKSFFFKDAVTYNGIINIQMQLLTVNHMDGTWKI